MSSLLQSGDLQHHIVTTLQPAYARRYYSLMSAIEKYLIPLGVELPQEDRDHMGYVDFATQFLPSQIFEGERPVTRSTLTLDLFSGS